MSREQPTLIPDVLLTIMSFSDDVTISRLMRTTRYLNTEGARYLLGGDDDTLEIYEDDALCSLISFLSANDGYRLRHLRGLSLLMVHPHRPTAVLLGDFLDTFSEKIRITTLCVLHLESLLECSARLRYSLSRLSTLKCVDFGEVGRRGSQMLSMSRSQLVTATIDWTRNSRHPRQRSSAQTVATEDVPAPLSTSVHTSTLVHEGDEDDQREDVPDSDSDSDTSLEDDASYEDEDSKNPVLVLSNSQWTLKSLSADNAFILVDGAQHHEEVYPHVTDLYLKNVEAIETVALVGAFPHLQNLEYSFKRRTVEDLADTDRFESCRMLNIIEQARSGSWKSLQSCRALLSDLFLLAPSCPIRTLYIKGPTFIVKAMRSVLGRTKPVHLSLESFDAGVLARGIVRVMGRPYTLQIECLEATLIAGFHAASPADVDAPAIVDGLVAAVGSLPALRVLVVSVLCYLAADPPCAAEAFMRGLDLDALARRLCAACPTLRTVVVLLSGVRGRANERVRRGPQCTEFELYADRMGNPGHRGTEGVG
ncbi:uncharacterized protein BXZ73DRAFT_45012 [Epithele typhae]|uniref:uncharacterized protein n=1 Tax=Epithele typhae TaxID=378194 RepID=UPI002008DF44|nr:uncharacterized protein BXZ73DRAFT_45012 [Epithele typhae]KAH9936767.1 hypothetical protein BXZ73DRAFT_45012 [Epithele typhae]